MKNLQYIQTFLFQLLVIVTAYSQQTPAKKQTQSILIINGTAHLGNGKIIENSLIGFKEGKLQLVADATLSKLEMTNYDITIDAKGKHIYPGFIAPNSTLGLVEVDALKASDDEDEIGQMNPNIKSIIAYNSESKVIETSRPNGILIAQITPRGGRISGTSSIVQLDAWDWQEAILKENDGIHLNFPNTHKRSGWWAEPGEISINEEYEKQLDEINNFFTQAKAYLLEVPKNKNLIFEATRGLFDASQTLYIHANEEQQIKESILLFSNLGIKKMVIVGGYEAYAIAAMLEQYKVPVLLRRVHELPENDDHDLDLPFKLAKILTDKGVLVGLENSGDMERMNTRNLPFLAGTCVAYGLNKEQALQLITLNTAKILGIDASCGSLETGKDATLFISEGDALDMRTNLLTHAFIQGRPISLETHQTQLAKKYKEKYHQE